jgi:putative DNA primase/helicase
MGAKQFIASNRRCCFYARGQWQSPELGKQKLLSWVAVARTGISRHQPWECQGSKRYHHIGSVMEDILSDFTSAIRQHGLTPPERLVADGKIQRFRSGPEKAENGFYRLSIVPAQQGGDIGFGTIGCWKRGLNEKWCSREPKSIGDRDRAAIDKARKEQKKADAEAASKAVEKAAWIWKNATAPDAGHPYLVAKGIEARGVRQYKGSLVVPVCRDGKLASLQFIAGDGSKRFLSGGQVEGGYASISAKDSARDELVIAEGYATAASLFEATGIPTIVGFNAGNLVNVAKAIRAKYPEARITVAADNDCRTEIRGKPVNVGLERGKEAALAVNGRLVWPLFDLDDRSGPQSLDH